MGTTAEKFLYLLQTKEAIKAKLIEKGVSVSDTDTFRSYADKLDEVEDEYEIIENVTVSLDFSDGNQIVSAGAGNAVKRATIIKPAELIPANIAEGVSIAGVVGQLTPLASAAEQKTVELDFSDGDMEISPTEGKLLSSVTIPQPSALVPENIAKGVEIAGIVGTHSGGSGGGSGEAVVWFVTFIGADGSVLYKMPVLDGDNCKDPLTTGKITTPTKESSVESVYTYSGWSLTEDGSASSNVLKAITEDKTVYAAFTSTPRKYTVTYYDTDGTTVLKTESLAYGTMPMYVPGKSGFSFIGWQPELATVVGNTSYIAQFVEVITFAGGAWADIDRICSEGKAKQYFSIGESRRIPITYCGVSYDALFRIAAFDHDDLADGSGKAAMTVVLHELKQACANALPITGDTKNLTYMQLPIYSEINNATLPDELNAVLKSVTKSYPKLNGNDSFTDMTHNLTRFMLSAEEAGCTVDTTRIKSCGGSAYELYQTDWLSNRTSTLSKIEYDVTVSGYSTTTTALRNLGSMRGGNMGRYCLTNATAQSASYNSNTNGKAMAVFGFCI